jgi:putative endonuclease
MTNKKHGALYIGVTSELIARINDHISKRYKSSFTAKYNLSKLVYYELFHSIEEAIDREKQLKAGSRKTKLELIEKMNPNWDDLYPIILKTW